MNVQTATQLSTNYIVASMQLRYATLAGIIICLTSCLQTNPSSALFLWCETVYYEDVRIKINNNEKINKK